MTNVYISGHPLIQHKLSIIRDKRTGVRLFRESITEVSQLLVYEVARDLPLEDIVIETPVSTTHGKTLSGKKLVIVPILRAGLGMVEGFLNIIPSAKVGHIGLSRDHETLMPIAYYHKLPEDIAERDVIVLDPMLATGGSVNSAFSYLKQHGAKSIKLMCIIAAPEGISAVQRKHPEIPIYCGAIDECLNEHGYIVPGLGDAGDRMFGTL